MTRLCCGHGLGLINTPGVQGPLFPLGRPGMAGMAEGGGNGTGECSGTSATQAGESQWECELQGRASALAASASVSFGGESAHPALPHQAAQGAQAAAVP